LCRSKEAKWATDQVCDTSWSRPNSPGRRTRYKKSNLWYCHHEGQCVSGQNPRFLVVGGNIFSRSQFLTISSVLNCISGDISISWVYNWQFPQIKYPLQLPNPNVSWRNKLLHHFSELLKSYESPKLSVRWSKNIKRTWE